MAEDKTNAVPSVQESININGVEVEQHLKSRESVIEPSCEQGNSNANHDNGHESELQNCSINGGSFARRYVESNSNSDQVEDFANTNVQINSALSDQTVDLQLGVDAMSVECSEVDSNVASTASKHFSGLHQSTQRMTTMENSKDISNGYSLHSGHHSDVNIPEVEGIDQDVDDNEQDDGLIDSESNNISSKVIMDTDRECDRFEHTTTPLLTVDASRSSMDEGGMSADEKDIDVSGNEDNSSDSKSLDATNTPLSSDRKRKSENNPEEMMKKLRLEIDENFFSRDKILNRFMELSDCQSPPQLQWQSEQLIDEIRMLNDMAKEKEREWNNIIHYKKMKEELLLRLQRKKEILLLNAGILENGNEVLANEMRSATTVDNSFFNGKSNANQFSANHSKNSIGQAKMQKAAYPEKVAIRMGFQQQSQRCPVDANGKQKAPTVDVQCLIKNFRKTHPENAFVPKRLRRSRNERRLHSNHSILKNSVQQPVHNANNLMSTNNGGTVMCDTGEVRTSKVTCGADSSMEPTTFRDILERFTKLSQVEKNEIFQQAIKSDDSPPFSEVSVHPVPTAPNSALPSNSLLHGILTKSPNKCASNKSTFSPTLARLLTAPERVAPNQSHPTSVSSNLNKSLSISEILSSTSARNEITITPVSTDQEVATTLSKFNPSHTKTEEEPEDCSDRLIIDETTEVEKNGRDDNGSDLGDDVPQCQGCNKKVAMFVCAGCGNQWCCSGKCQVIAWEEHSDVCTG